MVGNAGMVVGGCTCFSCRNRWLELCRDDHREDGGQKCSEERGRKRSRAGGRMRAVRTDQGKAGGRGGGVVELLTGREC